METSKGSAGYKRSRGGASREVMNLQNPSGVASRTSCNDQ